MARLLSCLGFTAGVALCLAMWVLAAAPAQARSFTVSIRVFCPTSWNATTNALDPTFTTVAQRPCAGIRVMAMDADPLWDEYCGAGYTDSRGFATFAAECGDTVKPEPEAYVRVEARSMNGFSVGLPDFSLWQRIRDSTFASLTAGTTMPLYAVNALRVHQTFQWLSPETALSGASLALGDQQIGASTADGSVSTMVARHFWAAQYTMFRLNAGTAFRPTDFNYTVSAAVGTPTTFYDTVLVRFTENVEPMASTALQAVSHEIGHVLYNTHHSGMLHWLYEDATDYLTNHARCDTDHFQTLAWYEGFADFIRDYVFQRWNWTASDWAASRPFRGCAIDATDNVVPGQRDMHIEGNVEAMLNNIFFGPVRQAQRVAIGQPTEEEFSCRAGQVRFVNAAGVVQCSGEVPASCTRGFKLVDHTGTEDQCMQFVRNPRCPPRAQCEPVEQLVRVWCSGGSRVQKTGPDACRVISAATHTLPNGTPRPRPDGTPDMTIGLNSTGARAWFSLPNLDTVIGWVRAEGQGGHRASEFWQHQVRPWCTTPTGPRARYCNPSLSSTFLGELQTLDPSFN